MTYLYKVESFIQSWCFFLSRTGGGKISASGGNGFAGGGGGRVSVEIFSRHDDSVFLVHGMANNKENYYFSFAS